MIAMKKILFEIPFYGITKEELEKKAAAYYERMKKKDFYADNETLQEAFRIKASPKNKWKYNHIVAYAVIYFQNHEIIWDCYTPEHISRYTWTSKVKHFMKKEITIGNHIYVSATDTNIDIQKNLLMIVELLSEDMLKRKMYIDRELFDNIYDQIDYKKLMEGMA